MLSNHPHESEWLVSKKSAAAPGLALHLKSAVKAACIDASGHSQTTPKKTRGVSQ